MPKSDKDKLAARKAAEQMLRKLRKHRFKPDRPSAEIVREMRDEEF